MYWPEVIICAVTNFGERKNQQLVFLCGDKTDLIERFMVKSLGGVLPKWY